MTVGRTTFDWEDQLGLIEPNAWDSSIGDLDLQAFKFKKDWGIANLELVIGRVADNEGWNYTTNDEQPGATGVFGGGVPTIAHPDYEAYLAAALVNFDINEKFRVGALGYFYWSDSEPVHADSVDGYTAGVYAGFKFHPSVELKGIYYIQDGDLFADDNATAWKAILDVNQDLLKFTSLWLEYAQIDNNFAFNYDADFYPGIGDYAINLFNGNAATAPWGGNNDNTTKLLLVHAQQKWNDKWSTFVRYAHWDFDLGSDDTLYELTFGVGYQYTDAVSFELMYDTIKSDQEYSVNAGNYGLNRDSDHLIRFRTFVTF
jgi:hypothetical protein